MDPDGRLFASLAPCFVTRFERTFWLLRQRDGSVVELALDIGQVEANGRQAPICELELELKAGPPAALFKLARQLGQGVALLPANRSKAERGFLLAQDALQRPQRAQLSALGLPLTRLELAQRVLREMFAQFSQNLETLCTSDDPEVVHQARVGWRRFRSGLRLFGKTLAVAKPPPWHELQALLAGLGAQRDLDVALTETLPALADGFDQGHAGRAHAWQAMLTALTQAAAVQRQQLRQTLQAPNVGLCLLALTEWLENLSASDPAGPGAAPGVCSNAWRRRRWVLTQHYSNIACAFWPNGCAMASRRCARSCPGSWQTLAANRPPVFRAVWAGPVMSRRPARWWPGWNPTRLCWLTCRVWWWVSGCPPGQATEDPGRRCVSSNCHEFDLRTSSSKVMILSITEGEIHERTAQPDFCTVPAVLAQRLAQADHRLLSGPHSNQGASACTGARCAGGVVGSASG
jgi:hypothetical protein